MDKDQVQRDFKARRDLPDIHGVYRHRKGGLYVPEAVGLVEDVPTLLKALGVPQDVIDTMPVPDRPAVLVTYRSNARETSWVRPLEDWEEVVEWPDGARRPRFTQEPH